MVGTPQRIEGDASTGTGYLYPSIAVNQFNDVLLGYSKSASNQYVGAYYRFMPFYKTQFQSEYEMQAGEGTYWKSDRLGRNRWGDYSTTVTDPANAIDFWTLQQYALAHSGSLTNGSGRWATRWAQVKMQQSSNDNFANAIELSGSSVTNTSVFIRPTKEAGEPNHLTSSAYASTWLKWTAPNNGDVTIKVYGDTFVPGVVVYSGSTISNLTALADSLLVDDGGEDPPDDGRHPYVHGYRLTTPPVTFMATAQATYRIALVNNPAANGNCTLTLNQAPGPLITIQPFPVNPHVIQGDPVTFTAAAIGTPTPAIKWQFSATSNTWADISGATAATCSISSVQSTNAGYYRLFATNSIGTATSAGAKLDFFATGSQPITNLVWNSSGFQFKQPEVQGYSYIIYASTNIAAAFSNWVAIATNVAGTNIIADLVSTNYPQRFYRSKMGY